jgi:ketosteroid isomerase-like protein
MSQANVELVKRAIDAINRLDLNVFDEIATADFEAFSAVFDLGGGSYRGREGVETLFGNIRDTWEELGIVAEEFRDLGDRVLVLGRMAGRGRGSGVPVDAPMGWVFDCRSGRISRFRSYLDHGEALRAAGLSE